ncbi:MAG: hypothetical protein ACTS73_09390 [Arsenophonus sp. NEOnobi-MAG3]
MICYEKSTIQISAKPDISCDPLHQLIRNPARNLIATALKLSLKPCCDNVLNVAFSTGTHCSVVCNSYLLQ